MKNAPVERVPISQIEVGVRRREKLPTARIKKLAKSIEEVGLVHPIVLSGWELVAGQCRLEACKSLGMTKILARDVGPLSDEDFRQIELEENTLRTDYTPGEATRERLRQIEAAEEVSRTEYAKPAATGGRPKGGNRAAAESLGVSEGAIRKTKKHGAAMDRYPVLEGPEWNKIEAVETAEKIDKIPAPVSKAVVDLISDTDCPKKAAKIIVDTVGAMPKTRQQQWLDRYRSGDDEQVATAVAHAMRKPTPPFPRLAWLRASIKNLEAVAADPLKIQQADIQQCLRLARGVLAASEEAHKKIREKEGFTA